MTPREAQVAKIAKIEKTLATCRKNQVKLINDLTKQLKRAKRDLAMYDKYQLEAEELKAKGERKNENNRVRKNPVPRRSSKSSLRRP